MRCLPAAATALLVELDDLPQTLGLLASLQAEPVAGVQEVVPGARTLLLAFDPLRLTHEALAAELARRPLAASEAAAGARIEIPVHYDGEDLAEVAGLLGIAPAEVVHRHTGSDWQVAFTGFAPGFAYLSGGDALLQQVPRRATPRTRLPAGAVAVAGGFSGVYPQASPGGWQILGQTLTPMWDLGRDPPALLQPGQRVRFIDAGPHAAAAPQADTYAGDTGAHASTAPHVPAIEIRRPGLQALLQDLGRPGQARQGVSASGALDRGSLRQANRLVGNAPDLACIEIVQGGFELVSRGDTVVAVTGAEGPLTLTAPDGRRWPVARGEPLALSEGDALQVGVPRSGLRSYVAVRGGFDRAPVLGSLSFDTLAQVGPAPLAAGERLVVRPPRGSALVGAAEPPLAAWPKAGDEVVLDVVLGPRTDWFSDAALATFTRQAWTVTAESNRVGLRLAGDVPLERRIATELPSEGTATGAIQVPASGQPVLFLADHPLTGGYPVIACVAPWHLDLAGQLPTGVRLRFNAVRAFAPIHP